MSAFQDFNYRQYRRLLESLRQKNESVCFTDLPLADDRARYFILRHDIDFSPDPALKMAKLEAELGVRSTYFLLLSLDHVNLLSKRYSSFPSSLAELGHEVGLHYDLGTLEGVNKDNLFEALVFQCEVLSNLTGAPVRSISMHNPSQSGADPFRGIREFINAYDGATPEISHTSPTPPERGGMILFVS